MLLHLSSETRESCEIELLSTSWQTKQLFTTLPTEGRTSSVTATTQPCQSLISSLTVGNKTNHGVQIKRAMEPWMEDKGGTGALRDWLRVFFFLGGGGLRQFLVSLLLPLDKLSGTPDFRQWRLAKCAVRSHVVKTRIRLFCSGGSYQWHAVRLTPP